MIFIIIGGFILFLFGVVVAITDKEQGTNDEQTIFSNDEIFETSKPKRHNGHCDGDCANCPPHYGYRYGRWYYGHDHMEGCEFGGNRGGGSRD